MGRRSSKSRTSRGDRRSPRSSWWRDYCETQSRALSTEIRPTSTGSTVEALRSSPALRSAPICASTRTSCAPSSSDSEIEYVEEPAAALVERIDRIYRDLRLRDPGGDLGRRFVARYLRDLGRWMAGREPSTPAQRADLDEWFRTAHEFLDEGRNDSARRKA